MRKTIGFGCIAVLILLSGCASTETLVKQANEVASARCALHGYTAEHPDHQRCVANLSVLVLDEKRRQRKFDNVILGSAFILSN